MNWYTVVDQQELKTVDCCISNEVSRPRHFVHRKIDCWSQCPEHACTVMYCLWTTLVHGIKLIEIWPFISWSEAHIYQLRSKRIYDSRPSIEVARSFLCCHVHRNDRMALSQGKPETRRKGSRVLQGHAFLLDIGAELSILVYCMVSS